jgi:hypothetical protein
MNSETISPSKERLIALEECERKIVMLFRRGIEATCALAKEFTKIEEQELYRDVGSKTFHAYVVERLGLEMQMVRESIAISIACENLKKAGLALPETESQVVELARVEAEHQPLVWQLVVEAAEKVDKRVTAAAVRDAVRKYEESRQEAEPAPAPRRGVVTALDTPQSTEANGAPRRTSAAPKVPKKIELYEAGEAALERIRRLCGDPIAKGIESGNLPISERDLIKWSEQTDDLVKTLAHYVGDLRWTVSKAINFEARTLNEATTLAELMTLARVRGGRYVEVTDLYKLTLQLVA